MNYNTIFQAHYVARLTSILHGSSGFGKTATVRAYAEFAGAKLIDKRLSVIDPLTLSLPYVSDDRETIKYAFAEWIGIDLFKAKEHTIIFFDEITNPSSPEVYNVMKELLGERTLFGRKVSDFIQFIGATNLESEDIGVKEMPDSLWKRCTHIKFVPTTESILKHLDKEARKFFAKNTSLLRKPETPEFKLDAAPRQIDACVKLFKTNLLTETELRICFAGRIGEEAGFAFADYLTHESKGQKELPEQLTMENLAFLQSFEDDGRALEVIQFIKQDHIDKKAIAQYLAQYAGAEVARSFHESGIKLPFVTNPCVDRPAGMPWQTYASGRRAISLKSGG